MDCLIYLDCHIPAYIWFRNLFCFNDNLSSFFALLQYSLSGSAPDHAQKEIALQ